MNLPNFLMLWLCLLFCLKSKSQKALNINCLQIGIGSSTLLGDLGGSEERGTYFLNDFDLKSSRYSLGASSDWILNNHFDYRISLKYLHLSADDKFSEELSRRVRNLSVKTEVIEFVPAFKYNVFGNLRQNRTNRLKNDFTHIYMTVGMGFIYFSPKAELNGKTYRLRKLNTEGQNLPGGANKYSNLSLVIPVCVGLRKDFNSHWAMFFELTSRKCFTDYLDDVSTNYYDQSSLISANGIEAASLADRNTDNDKRLAGTKRGNPSKNDSYFSIEFGIRKSFKI